MITRFTAMAAAAAAFALFAGAQAQAMPTFAKAYGVSCSTCHTMVPALNAYGRYVQRTGYSSLNHDVIKTVAPVWIGEQVNGDSTGGVSNIVPTHTSSFGNLAVHGAGYLAPDWTFHVQQWLLANDDGGGTLDTAWVTYNNLFHRDGHLFIGKYEAPAPSPFSQFFDISAFSTPEITVGEHAYQLDGNRWGSKLAYVHGALDAEAGWLLSGNGMITASDFGTSPGTDKTFQWKLASAHPDQPLEIGAYGSNGSYIVSTGALDRYSSIAAYLQRDPQPDGIPGIFAIYQTAHDSNPGLDANGNQLPAASSKAITAELYESLFNRDAVLGIRDEFSDDGLGNLTHAQNVDFAFNVPHMRYLHAYVEAGLGANSTAPNSRPTWRWMLWWTTPLADQ
ncbi:MAG TPA: hypothetical protein VKT72_12440 [Candidatus Baltobacteraceae bacterium]|nr:hypothetical protein [Candidatus Baltobacteraceae bacterium]